MFRLMLLLSLLSLAGCVDNEPPTGGERRLLLSGKDFAAYEAPHDGRYHKLVTYASRSIDLNFESQGSDWLTPKFQVIWSFLTRAPPTS